MEREGTVMTKSSPEEIEQHSKELREILAREKAEEEATGIPPDTSWTDDLPEADDLEDEDDVVVTFIQKS
jgi:hypothetical protein